MEKLLYEEILALEIIEELQSAWSSPAALVVKLGKVHLRLEGLLILHLSTGIFNRLPKARFTKVYV